ncbi:UDP-N-acetylglucosamine acyltransferase [Blastococcus xanthinilyticus]|uniref:UDP-N-acetylglucosamine acyltransferase n=2 Tax=Blastococcus xanthinilyticus TaxID=1564164 RepID=A0A5S5CKF3_9ACTN|nr:UDP-N-acetylglucosamine acyltransferase [Blastococcus xanthinilyticus]
MGNLVHPTAIIGPGVELGADTVIGPYAVLTGPLRVGDRTWIGAHAVIGAPPEVRGHEHGLPWGGEPVSAGVEIGADTVLREFTTVHGGTYRATRIGSRCYVMNQVYVGHDGLVEDDATLSGNATLAGHVVLGAGVTLGMSCTVHQRRVVGPGAMVGMGSVVTRDVPPFAKAFGSPARVQGVNEVGMSRGGLGGDDIAALAERYGNEEPTTSWTPPEALRPAWEWWLARTSAG